MQDGSLITVEQLMKLGRHAQLVTTACACTSAACAGWERVTVSFPETLMRHAGTLIQDPYAEPTYAEYHPKGSSYWSADAPIALRYFPYNRCQVVQCSACSRVYLRYTEGGGYYVEPRIRSLDPELIVDPPLPLD